MFEIYKSPKAESDLEEIWLYSFEQWGEAQADRYFDTLTHAINSLMDHPKLGKPAEQVRDDYRSLQVRHHVIYYKLHDDLVEIMRVLHEDMVPGNYL
ncbi:MAG: type II toxin-antitoxin system RelE/ParE family toxin [Parahaliea sp.]